MAMVLREADAEVKEIGILWDSATGRARWMLSRWRRD
jgi:hypothetical protein